MFDLKRMKYERFCTANDVALHIIYTEFSQCDFLDELGHSHNFTGVGRERNGTEIIYSYK